MQIIVAYVATLVCFLALDILFLMTVIQPAFRSALPGLLRDQPRLDASALFYLLYAAGLLWFAVAPQISTGSILAAARDGALIGLLAYGTYELTSMATVQGWTWNLVKLDLIWGVCLSAVAAAVGTYAAGQA